MSTANKHVGGDQPGTRILRERIRSAIFHEERARQEALASLWDEGGSPMLEDDLRVSAWDLRLLCVAAARETAARVAAAAHHRRIGGVRRGGFR